MFVSGTVYCFMSRPQVLFWNVRHGSRAFGRLDATRTWIPLTLLKPPEEDSTVYRLVQAYQKKTLVLCDAA
jgi:hypothetical protein